MKEQTQLLPKQPFEIGIDGDILLYKAAFSVEARGYIGYEQDTPVKFSKFKKDVMEFDRWEPYRAIEEDAGEEACLIFSALVSNIVRKTGAKTYKIYLTGKNNFRHKLYDGYKSTRGAKPLLYKEVKAYAAGQRNSVIVDGQEADDAMSIANYKNPSAHVIASIDKDLLMVPGYHYNFDKDVALLITPEEGLRHFYCQLLAGDRTDDIPGLPRIGLKTAAKRLAHCSTEEELWDEALRLWTEHIEASKEAVDPYHVVVRNARLLWMRTKEDEMWVPPTERQGGYIEVR